MMDKDTLVSSNRTPRPMRPEDKSYRDVMMLFSDQPVKPKYWFEDFGDYWSCSCGQINRNDTCSNCGLDRELLRRIFSGSETSDGKAHDGTGANASDKSTPAGNSGNASDKIATAGNSGDASDKTTTAGNSGNETISGDADGVVTSGDKTSGKGSKDGETAKGIASGRRTSAGDKGGGENSGDNSAGGVASYGKPAGGGVSGGRAAGGGVPAAAGSVAFAPTDENYESDEEYLAAADYMRKKHRTRVMMVILVFLIVLLGVGLAVFYFYGLPEMDRQENMETEAVTDSLAHELPGALPNVEEKDFDINRNIGDYYYEKKEYEKAVDHYIKALKIKDDESVRHKMNDAKYSYVSNNREKGGALFEDYLDDLFKAKYTGINDIYYNYYTWKASIVTNTGVSDFSTDMSSINRASPIYFHTTFSGGPPNDSLDLYYEIIWPDGTTEKKAISATKTSGETLTTTCQYTFPSTSTEGKLIYRLYNNSNNKQLATDSVTLL